METPQHENNPTFQRMFMIYNLIEDLTSTTNYNIGELKSRIKYLQKTIETSTYRHEYIERVYDALKDFFNSTDANIKSLNMKIIVFKQEIKTSCFNTTDYQSISISNRKNKLFNTMKKLVKIIELIEEFDFESSNHNIVLVCYFNTRSELDNLMYNMMDLETTYLKKLNAHIWEVVN